MKYLGPGSDVPSPPHGLRFDYVTTNGETRSGFVVRVDGGFKAYENRCAHMALELDWDPGLFFDRDNEYLMCSTHGARFLPDNGRCIAGPCIGLNLDSIGLELRDGDIYVEVSRLKADPNPKLNHETP